MNKTLKQLRTEEGLSLREAARRAGIDPAQLYRIESGQATPTIERLRQLGKVYGIAAWKMLQIMEREGED